MSQSSGYQYQPYSNTPGSLKNRPPMANGEPNTPQHVQNGTPSSQSSRDPSREPSRDPSPTHNQYRSQMPRSSMPPINGQQSLSRNPAALPSRMGQMQNYSPSGTPPPLQNSPSNVATSVSNAPMLRPPYSTTQPVDQPSNSQQISSTSQILSPNPTQTVAEPSIPPTSNQSYPLPGGYVKPAFVDNASDLSNVSLTDNVNITTVSQTASKPQSFTQFGPSLSHTGTTVGQVSRTTQNLSHQPPTQNNRPPMMSDPQTSSNVGNTRSNSNKSVESVNQLSSSSSTQPDSNQPSQTPFFQSPPEQPRSSTQNIFAPPNTNSATSLSSASFSSQPVYSSTQNLFSSIQNVQTNSQNALGTVQTAIPSSLSTQYSTQNSSTRNLQTQFATPRPPTTQYSQNTIPTNPQTSGSQTPYMSTMPSSTQYNTNQYSNPQATRGSQSNLSGPPTALSQSQSSYGSLQNLASQRKYPQNPYGIQTQPDTGNMAGPPLALQKPVLPPPAPVGLGQYQSGPIQAGVPLLPGQQPMNQNQYVMQPHNAGQMSNIPLDNMAKRYPGSYPDQMNQLNSQMGGLNVAHSGFNQLWGMECVDLLQTRNILPAESVQPPKVKLQQEFLDSVNCSPDIFRCTLTKIPESSSLLKKSRLPLGVLIHPFKDLNHLPVIQCSTIVRCRACRTYINPFVYFVDSKRWKCNLCYRVNELPEEFQFDPVTKSYGDPSRRPEVKTSTIEFIAPSEYMLRPPQPAVYLFVLDVSRLAVESGYLNVVCNTIADELTRLPGDSRTQVGFLAIDSALHFFSMPDNVSQPHEMVMLDVDDVFLPCPDNLIVNLKEREELIRDLLSQLPVKFQGTHDTNCALGAGLQTAFKLMSPTGGRVTVFQTCLPNLGPGSLQSREDPNNRSGKDVPHLNPATDFYKRIALDCSGQQIAVDLFLLNSQYSDLATLSGMCKFSGGCMYHIPLFRVNKPQHTDMLERMLRRYLTRKIGFEAVMRIRCTRGLSIDTFHGNFFVRSTDLLSLPNVNPDAGFGMQIAIEENLSDVQSVCFQAALLYTSSKGERRIRVHTLCLPVAANLSDILHSADQQCIIGLLAKMAVDRSQQSSLSDARDALINVAIDALSAYKVCQSVASGSLLAPGNLKLLPLYIIALLKYIAFRSGTSTRLDDRVFAMCQMKALPLSHLIQHVYPDMYPIHALNDENAKDVDGKTCPQPPRLHLSAEKLDSRGAFVLDAGDKILMYIGKNLHASFYSNVLGVQAFSCIPEEMYELPELDTPENDRVRNFIFSLQEEKPFYASLQIVREDSHFKQIFTERLIEDRIESALSYYEFLQHLKTRVK
ncbi:protein transport protein Sec24A isoform X1 [Neodiprion pinetum]|uniref:protein transport protein Sec24A isoform X1 n=1 Tax=Neodiprion pinetum TaxID=441929 RepID=UPI001EE0CDC7|nr:protein transport protein Sec24A [Neodiprion pinetum]